MKTSTLMAIILFILVASAHLLRVIFGLQVTVESVSIPMWASVLGFVIPSVLALFLWKEAKG